MIFEAEPVSRFANSIHSLMVSTSFPDILNILCFDGVLFKISALANNLFIQTKRTPGSVRS